MLGLYSYRQIRSIAVYSREAYTWRHLLKLSISALLSIISFVFLLVYLLTESDLSVKTLLAWGISCFIWVFNSILMRKEFEKLGYTTNYLKAAWIIMFVCHITLLIMGAAGLNTDDFSKILIIYSLNDFFLLVIILMGYFYADDYPNKKVYDVYSSISIGSDADLQIDDEDFKEFSPQKNSPSPLERRRQRNKGSFQPLLANDDLAKERIRPIRKSHSFAPSNTESKEVYLISDKIEDNEIIRASNLVRASSQPAQINLKEDVQNIEDIQIITFEEIMRNDKPTVLYVIVYHIKGQKFVTKRSYSEFDNLYKEIKRLDKNAPLPPMPSKKLLSSKTEGVKVDRIEVFDKILKILVTKKIGLKCLSEFLQTPDRLSFYGRLVPSRKSKSSPGEVFDDLQTPLLNRISDKPGGNEGINKYRVTGGKILKGTDNMINYQIKIIENESQSEITIIKRHKEFREFHGQLAENSDKRFKSQIPNLPDKLKVGPSSEDPKAIIEYRRAMLPRYLQTILNNPVLNGNPAILEFLKDAK